MKPITISVSSKTFKSMINYLYKMGELKIKWQNIKDCDHLILVIRRVRKEAQEIK